MGKLQNRFSFGGQVITQQRNHLYSYATRCREINSVPKCCRIYFSERYQQLLNIRFYGLFDIKVDPVLFYVSSISQQIEDHKAFTLQNVAQGTLRQNIAPKIAIAINQFTNENKVDIYSLNANQDTFNELAKQEVNGVWAGLYGIETTNIPLEDLSYDQESLDIVREA